MLKECTNGGRQDSTKFIAEFPGFFIVWYNMSSMINKLAWSDISRKFRIMVDTSVGRCISVHLSPSRKMIFKGVEPGLHLFRNYAHAKVTKKISGYSYLMLTKARLSDFNKNEIQKA